MTSINNFQKEHFNKVIPKQDGDKVRIGLVRHFIKKYGAGINNSLLDIGCGTGNYTQLLRNKFPDAVIKAVDICDKMIEVAQNKLKNSKIEFIVDDAETMILTENFDLITSNACFQWFDELDNTIAKYKNLLTEDGIILFSTFGPSTYNELAKSMECFYEENINYPGSVGSGCSSHG